jgi:hypothetical protein
MMTVGKVEAVSSPAPSASHEGRADGASEETARKALVGIEK